MSDAVKPEICLTGKLLYPVHICAILADTQEATVIETRNSVYSIQKV